jgi:hypothetical protein
MRFFCAFLSIVWLHCFFCNAMCSRSEMEMQNFMAVGSLAISFFLFFFLAESVTFCVYYLLSISQGCSFLLSRSNLLALASCKPWGLEVELSDSMFVPCIPPPPPPPLSTESAYEKLTQMYPSAHITSMVVASNLAHLQICGNTFFLQVTRIRVWSWAAFF